MEHITMHHVAIGFAMLSLVGTFVAFMAVAFGIVERRRFNQQYGHLRSARRR